MSSILESLRQKIKWKVGDKKEFLEDLISLYDDCIEDCETIRDKIKYYRKDKDNIRSDITIGTDVSLVDKYTNEANKLVSRPYSEYRKENPILEPGLWDSFSGTKDSKKKRMNEHINFINELRSEFVDAKKEVEECLEKYEFEKNEKEAHNQLDKDYNIDEDKILPDALPRDVRKDLSSKVDEMTEDEDSEEKQDESGLISRFRDNNQSDDHKEHNDKYESMMTSDKLAQFVILHIRKRKDQEYDLEWYNKLEKGHPEQAKDIKEQINQFSSFYSVNTIINKLRENIDCFYLDNIQEKYIKDVINGNIEYDKTTIETYRENNK